MKTTIKTIFVSGLALIISGGWPIFATVPDGWTSDFEAASNTAVEKNQKMLLLFTGSDWCIWCKRLHQEILDTEVFRNWASENIVLVYVDFPREDYRTDALREQNKKLDDKYDVSGYPTAIVSDASGKELARLGYMQGGPKTFIRAIQRAGH